MCGVEASFVMAQVQRIVNFFLAERELPKDWDKHAPFYFRLPLVDEFEGFTLVIAEAMDGYIVSLTDCSDVHSAYIKKDSSQDAVELALNTLVRELQTNKVNRPLRKLSDPRPTDRKVVQHVKALRDEVTGLTSGTQRPNDMPVFDDELQIGDTKGTGPRFDSSYGQADLDPLGYKYPPLKPHLSHIGEAGGMIAQFTEPDAKPGVRYDPVGPGEKPGSGGIGGSGFNFPPF